MEGTACGKTRYETVCVQVSEGNGLHLEREQEKEWQEMRLKKLECTRSDKSLDVQGQWKAMEGWVQWGGWVRKKRGLTSARLSVLHASQGWGKD